MFFIVAIVVLVVDLWTKSYVQDVFRLGESLPVIPNVFHLTYIINKGAAFGILEHQRWLLIAIVVILLGLIGYFYKKIKGMPRYTQFGLGALVGGAIGNGWDRYYLGGVVDFFDFRVWPIFNVADIGICVGVILVIYYLWKHGESKSEK